MKLMEVLNKFKFDLEIESELEFDEDKVNITKEFIDLCIKELGIKDEFNVRFVADRNKNNVRTTAFYDDGDKMAVIYAKNRMFGDILRSLAHELTHKRQYEQKRIIDVEKDGKEGSPIENEANAKAGEIIRKFLKKPNGQKIFS